MTFVVADRVKESTTTTGTGTVTLSGATPGFQSFAAIGSTNTTYYCIASATDWEVGVGTYTTGVNTLSRDTVLSSSNAGALVNFGVGSKDVFCALPSSRAVTWNTSGWSGVWPNAIDSPNGLGSLAYANAANGGMVIAGNTYYNGTNWIAKTANVGSLALFSADGSGGFYKAASVAAGATQSWTQLLGVDASGNVNALGNISASGTLTTSGSITATAAYSNMYAYAFGGGAAGYLTANTFYNGGNWIARSTGTGGVLYQGSDGSLVCFKLSSATTGAAQSLTQLMSVDTSGNLTASGNVTGFSDERYKTNWRLLPDDIIDKLANVKSGIYDRIDEDLTQVGVSAQSLQEILPDAVVEDKDGNLSVAYGNASLALLVAMAQKIRTLEVRLAKLEAA